LQAVARNVATATNLVLLLLLLVLLLLLHRLLHRLLKGAGCLGLRPVEAQLALRQRNKNACEHP
jgi:hypothetical protein